MNYLSIDIGTTACKCQVFDQKGNILEYIVKEYSLKKEGDNVVVDINAITSNVFLMIKQAAKKCTINSICISTFGETFVALDKDDNVLFSPMLYTDRRGEKQAENIKKLIGDDYAFKITGVIPNPTFSISKLLWVKENKPDIYKKIDKVFLICDYIGYLLTKKRVIDYGLAARSGVFDINKLEFSKEICNKLGVDNLLFSSPQRAGSIVGEVNNTELGLKNCTLVLGSHDQVCNALGSGIINAGQAVDGMGTVECITAVYSGAKDDEKMARDGYCCLPYAIEGLYCTYIVNYSSGLIINWFKNNILHNYKGDEKSVFAYLEKGMSDLPSDLLVLPYFSGALIPYDDINAKGAIIGLTAATTDSDIYQAIMEGLSYEMKFETSLISSYDINIDKVVATGGGANSKKWLQMKADIQKLPYSTLRSSEGGLCGCAILQAVAIGGKTHKEAVAIFVKKDNEFLPREQKTILYENNYNKYKKLYKAIKEFF